MRKFEVVREDSLKYGVKKEDIILPIRKTKHSVGYDLYSPIDISISPNSAELIWTNVKAAFNEDEAMIICVTGGMGKNNIILANGVGLFECDYYGNESNDGNIGFRLYNYGKEPYVIKAGEKVGQAFFFKFLKIDDEVPPTAIRKGGFGSTGLTAKSKADKK